MHHLFGNCSDYEYLAKAVTDFAVITPDIVGRGQSDWLSDASLYNYDTYRESVIQLMRHLGVKEFRFLGASMGGIVGMFLAQHYPTAITHLILNDIGPYMRERPLQQVLRCLESYRSFKDLTDARRYLKTWLICFGIDQEEFWDHLVVNYVKSKNGTYKLAYDPAIGPSLAGQVAQGGGIMDIWDVWDAINCKTLVLRGAQSNVLTTDIISRMLEGKSDIEVIKYPNVGHLPALYPRNRIDDILRWLQRS
ncbi:alpha/beta fold hydrolase [Anaplasma platys]|uniref:alpha/beta fold hydrolase n=1 Tax=Anaplasma platys TaxID=949 RepID=UPI00145D855F|nr:alpha/beta hydrolase [Anaplasma platys]